MNEYTSSLCEVLGLGELTIRGPTAYTAMYVCIDGCVY